MSHDHDGPVDPTDALELGRQLTEFLALAKKALPSKSSAITSAIQDHLGGEVAEAHTVAKAFDPSEHVNLQLALDRLLPTPEARIIGLDRQLMHYGGFSLPGLATGGFQGPLTESPVDNVNLAAGPDQHVDCMRMGLVLGSFNHAPVVLLVALGQQHGPEAGLRVEVMASSEAETAAFLTSLTEEMRAINVYRGQTISFSYSEYGTFGLEFVRVPELNRSQVILPEETLDAIDQHAIGISSHAEALLAAGQHLKRGLLLYGPPGTGKTHTVMYLANAFRDRTTIVLAGPAVAAVGQAGAMARSLAPATIVVEDVDLIGNQRGGPGVETNPLLFQLLNEMDGMAADADVLFVLTTNRVETLEPALAARPGRVDQALEIPLPGDEARSRLLDLYLAAPLPDDIRRNVIERTEGVAAAFIKELARRATLRASRNGTDSGRELHEALDEMVLQASPLLLASLGGATSSSGSVDPGPSMSAPIVTHRIDDEWSGEDAEYL